jgi:hypothetical protein
VADHIIGSTEETESMLIPVSSDIQSHISSLNNDSSDATSARVVEFWLLLLPLSRHAD